MVITLFGRPQQLQIFNDDLVIYLFLSATISDIDLLSANNHPLQRADLFALLNTQVPQEP